MRIQALITLATALFLSGAPAARSAPADQTAPACAATLAVLRSYTRDHPGLAVLDGSEVQKRDVPKTWKDEPSAALTERFIAGPGKSFVTTCTNGPSAFRGLGVVATDDPGVQAYLRLGLATLSESGDEALVEAGYTNRGFGGHCALYHLRRDANGWRIVDERATCII